MPGLTFRLDFKTEALRSLELPIEVRRPNAVLITTALSSETIDLPVGEYYATTRLPGGQRLVTPFRLTESAEQTPQPVVLAPDPEDASPHEWEEVAHFLGRAAAVQQAASLSSAGPDQRYATGDSSNATTALPAPQLCVYSGNVIRRTHMLESAPALLGHGRADPGRLAQFQVPPGRELLVAQLVQPGGPVQNIALPRSPEVGIHLVVSLMPAGDHRIEARLANHTADMLLQYSGYGASTTATIAGRSSAVDGEQLLQAKSADPIAAAVGAYAILRVGDVMQLHDWTANLLEWFDWLPDGAAIYGEHLARMGHHADAIEAFAQIPVRGLPLFSDGLFYAVERLKLYANRTWKNERRLDVSLARSVLDELEPFAPLMRRQRPVSTYPGLDVSQPDNASAPQGWSNALALDLHPLLMPVPSDAESKPTMTKTSDVVSTDSESFRTGSPVRKGAEGSGDGPKEGVGLCLSGGGYRAMLFHVGVLKRLNLAGWLPRLDRVSSVSGGSITAGLLGLRWDSFQFVDGVATNFDDLITDPLRGFAHTKVDVPAVAVGGLLPFVSISDRVVGKLKKHLFGDATMQHLTDELRFVINATNLESGVLMRFSKPYLADYKVGMVMDPQVTLAEAVAASSAFPPFLSPFELDLSDARWTTVEGNVHTSAGYRSDVLLSDGGVYDNLGLESVWDVYRTVLVSDAGGHLGPDPDPEKDWARGIIRVLHIMDSQVRALRRRAVIDNFNDDHDPHNGFFISTVSDYSKWRPGKRPYMVVDNRVTERLAAISTRLTDLPDEQQEMLINWGFAAADAGILARLDADLPAAPWPYPERPLT